MAGPIEDLLTELSGADVRYVVVGGVAVVLHGYLRATADLDLIIDLEPANIEAALRVFDRFRFKPRAPVSLHTFANAEERRRWVEEKNLQVFSLWRSDAPGFEVDLFVEAPLPFENLYERAASAQIGHATVRVASIDDLIAMKRTAGRRRDREDIEALLRLKNERERPKSE
jgi:predicted nucleotidyltransferase